MDYELPKNVVKIEQLKINRGLDKICSCKKRRFTIDSKNRRVICDECGSTVDPYDAMYELAMNGEKLKCEVEQLLEQRKQIAEYRPWLVVIKNLEKQYRGRKKLPTCPRCKEPFYLEELKLWMGKQFADLRIKKWWEGR